MLKIKQSYHGTGGREGYKYEVYDGEDEYLGEIEEFPLFWSHQETVKINDKLYIVEQSYDSDLPHEEVEEVVYHILREFVGEPDDDLGGIKG